MKDFTVDNLTDEVIEAYTAHAQSPRLKQLFTALIRHLHAFARDVELTEAEWFEAIMFLTATGQKCNDQRQEFILLSDTLGLSMLVDALNHPKGGAGTESTVLGPFFVDGAPAQPYGADLRRRELAAAEPCLVLGKVTDEHGNPIAGATIDVWQTAANGFYDVQDASAPEWNLRAQLSSNAGGEYAFVTEKQVSYPVPTDGPVGRMLAAAGRHGYRPAHVHFKITAAGHQPLTTHVFVKGDTYLDSDAVFATKDSLVGDFVDCTDAGEAARFGLGTPYSRLQFDFGLMRR